MLNDNIKALRKQRGMSQESMAIQLNVVRQTISKWEKGLSVPDADMLMKIADLFQVEVSELLGERIEKKENSDNDIAVQLSILNEQLARKNNRSKKIVRALIIALIVLIIIPTVAAIAGVTFFTIRGFNESSPVEHADIVCVIGDNELTYGIDYDEKNNIITAGGNSIIADTLYVEQYDKADDLIKAIEEYASSQGGTAKVERQDYDQYMKKVVFDE